MTLPKKHSPFKLLSEKLNKANAVLLARWRLRNVTHLGVKARVYGRVIVNNWGHISLGDNIQIVSQSMPVELGTFSHGSLTIGHHVFINKGASIAAVERVSIGNHCHIGVGVSIMDNGFHRLEPERRNERPESKPVIIEDNVWLGNRVMVMPGVTIGEGAAIGAGSIVTKDIPSRALAVGVPAKVLRYL